MVKVSVRPECFTGRIEELEWPERKPFDEFDFGYVLTVHKAQGATVDVSLLLVDDQSYREAAYTGLSRGRAANCVYGISEDRDAIEAHAIALQPVDELTTLHQAVARTAAQEMASRSRALGR